MEEKCFCRGWPGIVVDQTGTKSYPNVYQKQGQYLYEFEDKYVFVLENHVYRTAGHQHWPEHVKTQDFRVEGVSLNKALFAKAFSSHDKNFVVYDSKKDRMFVLENKQVAVKVYGTEKIKGKKLVVLPLEAFKEESNTSNLPKGLKS